MKDLYIHGYRLNLTCLACPEQYDVYDPEGTQVAYMRLRHGKFRVFCQDAGEELVHEVSTIGDGTFIISERLNHLTVGINKVQEWILKENFSSITDYE